MISLRKLVLTPPPATMPDLAEFMTTQAAAKVLSLHSVTIRNMRRSKKLDGVKIGGKTWLVSKKSAEKYRLANILPSGNS